MRSKGVIFFLVIIGVAFFVGCAEAPKQPVMRPIPPPPPTPPPGVAYVPPYGIMTNSPSSAVAPNTAPFTSAPNNLAGVEVSSNFVAGAQNIAPGSSAEAAQAPPQYEMVQPQPGPDYVWRNGYWRWDGAWVWIPGEWVYRPPSVIVVPGWYYQPQYGPWYHGHYHRW